MVLLDGDHLALENVYSVAVRGEEARIAPEANEKMLASRAIVERLAAGDAPVYGVNTGVGLLADVRIQPDELEQLQRNVVRSHACGAGEPLSVEQVRAMMLIRANVLAKGYSGIRPLIAERLCDLLNRGVTPVVPSRGSVGASGDLAPLAHMALVLIGEGEARFDGHRLPGAEALFQAGIEPLTLASKEGVSLLNGTQAMLAVGCLELRAAYMLAITADVICAMTLDALRGTPRAFDPRLHALRPHGGQAQSAENLRRLLDGSEIRASHATCRRVQDAYSLRCAAQVHGAARDALRFVADTLTIEANAATDNPMVFADRGEIVSGGNFHGAPVAIAADLLAIALAQFATISERRSDRLVNPVLSDLPAFLTPNSGLQSGYMLAQVTAAALVSEIKTLAHPASVDTIPTSANREDHVSMSMGAALKAQRALELATEVLAIEILCACQAIDLLAPLETSPALRRVHAHVRAFVPMLGDDRPPAPDIDAISKLITCGSLESSCALEVK